MNLYQKAVAVSALPEYRELLRGYCPQQNQRAIERRWEHAGRPSAPVGTTDGRYVSARFEDHAH